MMPQSNTAHTKAQSEPKASCVARIIKKPPEYEVSFDSGDDEKGAPKDGGQRLNDFLALFMLGGRADLGPTLNKTGIMFQEIERDDSRQQREENPKNPRRPEMESSGGSEKREFLLCSLRMQATYRASRAQ